MIKKIKETTGIALFAFLIVGGMVAPFFYTPEQHQMVPMLFTADYLM